MARGSRTSPRRRFGQLAVAVLLAAAGLTTLAPSAAAHGPSGVPSDDASRDATFVASDGTLLKVRILVPTGSRPSGGWPMIISLPYYGANRCVTGNMSYLRQEMVNDGYIVVSYQNRGMPAANKTGVDTGPFGAATGCSQADTVDMLDDTGADFGGPTDQADLKTIVSTMIGGWAPAGCTLSTCILNKEQIGAIGLSYGGTLAWSAAMPPEYGGIPEIKAVVPIAAGMFVQDQPTAISNYPIDKGYVHSNIEMQGATGWLFHSNDEMFPALSKYRRARYNNEAIPSTNLTGTMDKDAAGDDKRKLTLLSGTPGFTVADVGQPIIVAGAGALGVDLVTTIESYVAGSSGTQVILKAPALTDVNSPGGRTVWGTQAWLDHRTVVAGDGPSYPAADKAHLITKPTFVMAGWLDGAQQFVPNLAHIEAYKRINTTSKYLYLGTCSHAPDPCQAGNKATIKDKLHKFFDRHVKGTSDVVPGAGSPCPSSGPCVFFQVPPPWISDTNNPVCNLFQHPTCSTPDNWTFTESTSWPPPAISGSPHKFYLHWNKSTGGCTGGAGCLDLVAPAGGETASRTFVNNPQYPHPNNPELSPSTDLCAFTVAHADANASLNEVQVYDSPVLNNSPLSLPTPLRMVEATADLWVASDTTRLQVVADLYDVDGSGVEHRIAQTSSINVPTIRSGYTANTPVRVTFQPTGSAWTLASGHKLRLKVASHFRMAYNAEPWKATYTVFHDPSGNQSSITFRFAA